MEAPWDEVFDLMWEAYRAGTIPVGAVVADESDAIVSRGRNRIFDAPFDGQLAGTRLAHAEVNALVALSSERTHEGLTLYSALEPCHLCLSAAISARVGAVRYAARDPYAGAVGKLVPTIDHTRHPIRIEGPLRDARSRLAGALHVAHFLWRVPDGSVVSYFGETEPDLVALARDLPAPDEAATLAEALAVVTRSPNGAA